MKPLTGIGGAALAVCAGCMVSVPPPQAVTLTYDFDEGLLGWSAGLSDYPVGQEPNLQFLWRIAPLPDELGEDARGLYVQSFNTPDDLFTFITRRLGRQDGLAPGVAYEVSFTLTFASNAPSNCAGVGGAPGESVYLKAGASADQPQAQLNEANGYVVLNVDKADQADGGPAASVTGHIANGIECGQEETPYVSITRTHVHDSRVTAGADGQAWLLIGTDSGYEAMTALYYQRIVVTLTPVSDQ